MKKLLLLALLGVAGYAYHTNPAFEAHQAALVEELAINAEELGVEEEALFRDLDYSSFLVASATKDTVKLTMVSYGYFGKVKVVDPSWRPKLP